jgi:D-arabinose 1-dehydrogenase-like Zn-dependent alcohol dehydrogenase
LLTGKRRFSPLVPGHEVIGRVAAVGADVVAWKVGDRIGAGWHGGHDGKSDNVPRVKLKEK